MTGPRERPTQPDNEIPEAPEADDPDVGRTVIASLMRAAVDPIAEALAGLKADLAIRDSATALREERMIEALNRSLAISADVKIARTEAREALRVAEEAYALANQIRDRCSGCGGQGG